MASILKSLTTHGITHEYVFPSKVNWLTMAKSIIMQKNLKVGVWF